MGLKKLNNPVSR